MHYELIEAKPGVSHGVQVWVVAAVLVALAVLLGWGLASASTAPGCGNQTWRPRASQCCPSWAAGEPGPPKCHRWKATHEVCCGHPTPTPQPTLTWNVCVTGYAWVPGHCVPLPSPTPACPSTWPLRLTYEYESDPCPSSSPTCLVPTPLPTPVSHQKGECCREVALTYKLAKHAFARKIAAERRALRDWKQAQMGVCRGGY